MTRRSAAPTALAPSPPPGTLTAPATGPEILAFLEALGRWVGRRSGTRSTSSTRRRQLAHPTRRVHRRDHAWPCRCASRSTPGTASSSSPTTAVGSEPTSWRRWRSSCGDGCPIALGAPDRVHAHRGVHARDRARGSARTRRCRATRSAAPGVASRILTVRATIERCRRQIDVLGVDPAALDVQSARLEHAVAGGVRDEIRATVDDVDRAVTALERDLIKEASRRASPPRTSSPSTSSGTAIWWRRPPRSRTLAARCAIEIADPPELAVPDVSRHRSATRRAGCRTRPTPRAGLPHASELDQYADTARPVRAGARSRQHGRYGAPLARARRPPRVCSARTGPGPGAPASPRMPTLDGRVRGRARSCCGRRRATSRSRAQRVEEYQHAVRVAVGAEPGAAIDRGDTDDRKESRRDAPGVHATGLHRSDRGRLLQRVRDARRRQPGHASPCPRPTGDTERRRSTRRSPPSCRATPIGSARAGLSRPTRRLVERDRTASSTSAPASPRCPSAPGARPAVGRARQPRGRPRTSASAPTCGEPVGRSPRRRAGRTEGFCPKCGTPFSFTPKLQPGDVVGGQYEVVGLHRARRPRVDLPRPRPERVRPLRRAEGPAEHRRRRRATRPRSPSGSSSPRCSTRSSSRSTTSSTHEGAGYIVMEYVGGQSLKQILKDRMTQQQRRVRPVPRRPGDRVHRRDPARVLVPALAGPALLRLQARQRHPGRRPHQAHRPRRRAARRRRPVARSTAPSGYQAPEVADVGPSVASDIFTIGRTLAVLAMEFRGYQSTYVATLPPVDDTPLFQRYDSLYRVLAKATATNPDDRFQSADELRDQLLGVLREVVAVDSGSRGRRALDPSALFGSPTGDRRRARVGRPPALRVDRADAVGDVAGRRVARRRRRSGSRCSSRRREQTVEVQLAKARAAIDAGVVPARRPDRRRDAHRQPVGVAGGVAVGSRRAARRPTTTPPRPSFNTVLGQVPGRARAQARARARVRADRRRRASPSSCTRSARRPTRTTSRPAAFGLARTRGSAATTSPARSRRSTSSRRRAARTSRARRRRAELLTAPGPGLDELAAAAASIDGHRDRSTATGSPCRRRSSSAALDRGGAERRPAATHVGPAVAATEQRPARRRRARVPRAGHAHVRSARSASGWSTPPTPIRPRTLV